MICHYNVSVKDLCHGNLLILYPKYAKDIVESSPIIGFIK
jgi:hypothetical protein